MTKLHLINQESSTVITFIQYPLPQNGMWQNLNLFSPITSWYQLTRRAWEERSAQIFRLRTEEEAPVLTEINRWHSLILSWRPSVRMSGPPPPSPDHISASERRILYVSARREQVTSQLEKRNRGFRTLVFLKLVATLNGFRRKSYSLKPNQNIH